MSDLIDRQAAIDEVQYELEMINHALDSLTLDYNTRERLLQRKVEAREILNSIETLPSVDAVPVVRCRDCKWWHKEMSDDGKIEYINYSFCEKKHQGDGHEWYCPDGERREENG